MVQAVNSMSFYPLNESVNKKPVIDSPGADPEKFMAGQQLESASRVPAFARARLSSEPALWALWAAASDLLLFAGTRGLNDR